MANCNLSIIIPVYNVEAYVRRTLESVFNTTALTNQFEVIVVNDGTRDGSMGIVRSFEDQPNITILEQENQGLSAARTKGLSVAKGEYVWFIDSDDALINDGVGVVLRLLAEKKETEVLMFPILWVYDNAEKGQMDYLFEREIELEGKEAIKDRKIGVGIVPRYVFKRSLFNHKWLYFPKGIIHEDEYFGTVLVCLAKRIRVLKEHVYIYYLRTGSIMSSLSVHSSDSLVTIHKLLIRFMRGALDRGDWGWFQRYCFHYLDLCYTRNVQYLSPWVFFRFSFFHGFYVWLQWLKIYSERPLKNKVGRLFHFMLPSCH